MNALIWLKGFDYQSNKSHSKIGIVNHDIIFWIIATSIQLCLLPRSFICLNNFFLFIQFSNPFKKFYSHGNNGQIKEKNYWNRYRYPSPLDIYILRLFALSHGIFNRTFLWWFILHFRGVTSRVLVNAEIYWHMVAHLNFKTRRFFRSFMYEMRQTKRTCWDKSSIDIDIIQYICIDRTGFWHNSFFPSASPRSKI